MPAVDAEPGERLRLVAWQGVEPARIDAAEVRLAPDRLRARGTSLAPGYALSYRLVCGPAWVTEALHVHIEGDRWWRDLDLRRDGHGAWTATRREGGTAGSTSAPGTERLGELDGALDCDLGLCPITNTMPILRHGLAAQASRDQARGAELAMAWVDVPSLEVLRSEQVYRAGGRGPGGGAIVEFSTDGFAAAITVDGDGLVVDYPGIGRRLPATS